MTFSPVFGLAVPEMQDFLTFSKVSPAVRSELADADLEYLEKANAVRAELSRKAV